MSSEMPICIGEIKLMRLISRATPCGSGAHISSDDASGMLNAAAIAIKSSAPLPLVGIGQKTGVLETPKWGGPPYPSFCGLVALAPPRPSRHRPCPRWQPFGLSVRPRWAARLACCRAPRTSTRPGPRAASGLEPTGTSKQALRPNEQKPPSLSRGEPRPEHVRMDIVC